MKKMRTGDLIMIAIPIITGAILLMVRQSELQFYSLESPFMWAFLAFGIGIGIFIMAPHDKPKESLLGVPVEH